MIDDDDKKLLDDTAGNDLSTIGIGSLLTVWNLIAAGLKSSEDSEVLYIRKESKRMMDILDKMTSKPIQFQGCPGVGKSTTLFGILESS